MATNYYIADAGDDTTGSGTIVAPWKTYAKAITIATATSDAIYHNRGDTFPITARCDPGADGTANAPYTIGAYGSGAKPVVDGRFDAGTFSDGGGNVWNATITNTVRHAWLNNLIGTYKSGGTGTFTTPGDWYYTGTTFSIYATSDPTGLVKVAKDTGANVGLFFVGSGFDYVTIRDLVLLGSWTNGFRASASTSPITYLTLIDVEVRYSVTDGFQFQGHTGGTHAISNLFVSHCTALANGRHGFIALHKVTSPLFEDCLADGNGIWTTGWHGFSAWGDSSVPVTNPTWRRCIAQNQVLIGIEGAGFQPDDLTTGPTLIDCMSLNNGGSGYFFNGANGAKMTCIRCIAANCGTTVTRYGFAANVGANALSFDCFHCVSFNCGSAAEGGGFLCDSTVTAIWRNCIGHAGDALFAAKFVSGGSLTENYNCWYRSGGSAAVGFTPDGTDVSTDPLFVNSAANDFRLAASSPCLNAGVAIAGINDAYTGAAPDMGAYEAGVALYAFRFYNDTGDEDESTPIALQNVDAIWPADANLRLRVQLDTNGGFDPAAAGYELQYRKLGDSAWTKLNP